MSAAARAAIRSGAGIAVRRAALEILMRAEYESAFADVLLGARLPAFAPPDRRLITRLVLGVLAWRRRLDYELERLASRPLQEATREALEILRLGLFQLRFLSRIPAHAAVDTAVALASENPRTRGAAGFVNAVLRAALRRAVALSPNNQGGAGGEAARLGLVYSHPDWLAERFIEWFGAPAAERLMAADNQAAPNVVRLNLARGKREELIAEAGLSEARTASSRFPETVLLEGAANFDEAYRRGLFYPQSEPSQMVARLLAPKRGAWVLDCAAAPGGKASHLAELIGERGRVLALDLNFGGLRRARALAERLGHKNISFARADLTRLAPLCTRFDYVLLDAPCTGLGTLREHPEIRWRLQDRDIERMAEVQSRMLENAAALVCPGGAMVYAVCSLAPAEGRGVIRGFLARHPEFRADRHPPARAALSGLIDAEGFMSTRPDGGELDGFFAARLLRRLAAD